MSRLKNEKQVIAAVWNGKALWAIHIVANAVLAGLIYEWLWIPDRTILHLVLSAISGLAIIALILWLNAGTLAHFRAAHAGEERQLGRVFLDAARKLFPFALWAFILAFVIWLTFQLNNYREQASNWIASFLSLNLRRPVTPSSIDSLLYWTIVLVALVVIPMLFLPLGSSSALEGFRGFAWGNAKRGWAVLKRLRNWAAYAVLLVLGVLIPYRLVWWVPEVEGLYPESTSLIARFLVAYLLAVTSWLLLASMAGSWSNAEKR